MLLISSRIQIMINDLEDKINMGVITIMSKKLLAKFMN